MSFQAMAWAVGQKLPTKEKIILLMMANYADENGKCWPSMNRLCDDTGMKKDSVIRAIKSLESLGLIETSRRKVEGVNLPNNYHLKMQGVVAHSDHGVVANSDKGSRSQRLEPINEPIKDSISIDFEEFWDLYPKKVGKLAALAAFKRAVKICDPEIILDAAELFAEQRFGQDDKFTPNPANWLAQGRWDDKDLVVKKGPPSQEDMNRRAEEFIARKKLEDAARAKHL